MKHLLRFYILVFFLTSDFKLFAQPGEGPGDDDGGGGLEGDDPIPGAPINSKIIYLLLAGILFSMYKLRPNKQTT